MEGGPHSFLPTSPVLNVLTSPTDSTLRGPGKQQGSLQSNVSQQDPQGTYLSPHAQPPFSSFCFLLATTLASLSPHPAEELASTSRSPLIPITGLLYTYPWDPCSSQHPTKAKWLLCHCVPGTALPHQTQIFCIISTCKPLCLSKSFTQMTSWVLRGLVRILPFLPFHLLGPSLFPFFPQKCSTRGFALASLLLLSPREANHSPSRPALFLCP